MINFNEYFGYNLYVQIISRNEGFGRLLWLGLKVDEGVRISTCPHLKYKGKCLQFFALLINQL